MNADLNTTENTQNKANPFHNIALIGNPNTGKTTLFNALTGARQTTGNWPGVTVSSKQGQAHFNNKEYTLIDLPGIYSLDSSNASIDEQITCQFIQDNPNHLFLNIVDACNLQRSLYITLQLRELGLPIIVLLNRMDIAKQSGISIDIQQLSSQLGCPVIPLSLKQSNNLQPLYQAIHHFTSLDSFEIEYTDALKALLSSIQKSEKVSHNQAIRLLEGQGDFPFAEDFRYKLKATTGDDLEFLLADGRFDKANQLAKKVVTQQGKITRSTSDKIDYWVLGSWTGIPIFLFLMYTLFLFSINFGGALIDFFDLTIQTLLIDGGRVLFTSFHLPEWLITLLTDGIGGGIQVVATFIPIIGALFFFLSLLEESGYMARAAFVMDRFMRRLGVSGKSFVPLIIGFGCNVPGIMAARTLDSPRERILTVMMSPFMSCGARLAVYALFAAAFFPVGGQNIVFLLYLIGIIFAILTAFILKKTLLKGQVENFFIELPTYQVPSIKNVLINTWNKLKSFIIGAGKIIIIVVALINITNSLGMDGSFGHQNSDQSVLSVSAKAITPLFSPMGLDNDNWPATVGIITGLLAKEVVVGTLDALYSNIDQSTSPQEIPPPYNLLGGLKEAINTIPVNTKEALNNITDPLGIGAIKDEPDADKAAASQEVSSSTFGAMLNRFHGKIGAFAYLLFILLYFPCVAATGAMVREVGKGWAILGVTWTTLLAYTSAVIFYQLATLNQHPIESLIWTGSLLALIIIIIKIFSLYGNQVAQPPVKINIKTL